MNYKIYPFLLPILLLLIGSCNYSNEEEKALLKLPKKELSYLFTKGKALLDSARVAMKIEANDESFYTFYITYGGDIDTTVASMNVRATFSTKAGGVFHSVTPNTSWTKSEDGFETKIRLFPKDYYKLKAGEHKVYLNISTSYKRRKNMGTIPTPKSPFQFEAEIPMEIFEVYKTKLYFSTLVLNKKEAMKALMDKSVYRQNDLKDPTPEACIDISYLAQNLVYCYSENKLSLYCPKVVDIYYAKGHENLKIKVMDKDYFPNPDDLISDTTMTVTDLQANSFRNLKMPATDKLLIYTKGKQKVN